MAEEDPIHTESLTPYLILLGFSLIYFAWGIIYGWAEQNTYSLASSIIALFIGLHLIGYIRVALKYRKIALKIFDRIQEYSVHFWNLKCDITMKNDSPLSLLYLPGFCPYFLNAGNRIVVEHKLNRVRVVSVQTKGHLFLLAPALILTLSN